MAATDKIEPEETSTRLVAYRCILVAAQAATILLTWKVWQVREVPPLLPLVAMPRIDMGLVLLASLSVVLLRPRIGVPIHTGLLVAAIITDQCRLQPHVISLCWLMWGTTGWPGGLLVARSSLVATWLWAGIHKLTSPAYYTFSGAIILRGLWPDAPASLAVPLAAAIALTEIGLGIGTLLPSCRRFVAVAAVVFHVLVIGVLAFGFHWDCYVWPWNMALACSGPLIVATWRGHALGDVWLRASRLSRGIAITLLVMPVGYWFGVVDAYLAHCIYADNTPRAFISSPFAKRQSLFERCLKQGVVVPPAHRLFEPCFRVMGQPGEWLEIEDPRWIARLRGSSFGKVRHADLEDGGVE
jgi:uncharacterized membrane protein YphA (DoxX/SURF4 family)